MKVRALDSAVQNWIDVSKEDIEASELLYSKGKYSNLFYHFQQASEKAYKALVLELGIISESEIRSIGHFPLKSQRKIGKATLEELREFKEMQNVLPSSLKQSKFMQRIDLEEIETMIVNGDKVDKHLMNQNTFEYSPKYLNELLQTL